MKDENWSIKLAYGLGNLVESYRKTTGPIIERLAMLEAEKDRLPQTVTRVGVGLPVFADVDRRESILRTELETLGKKTELRFAVLQEETSRARYELDRLRLERGNVTGRTAFDAIGIEDKATAEDLGVLTAQLDHLEANRGDATFVYIQKTFASQLDVLEWVVEQKIGSCGSFWDLFSILVRNGTQERNRDPKGSCNQSCAPEQC